MARVLGVALLLLAGLGCERSTPSTTLLHAGPAGAPDELDRLIARLPPGADRCAGARVGTVPAERRDLVRRLSGLDTRGPLAWSSGAPIAAYAEVQQENPERRRRAIFGLVRVSSVEATRTYLDRHPGMHIRWTEGGDPCPGADCWELRAEPVDERTVRIRRGPWEDHGRGTEVRCVDLARRFPDALEVSAWTAADGLFSSGASFADEGLGFDVASVLAPFGRGLRRLEQYRLPHADLADEIAMLLQAVREEQGGIAAIAQQTKVAQGDVLEIRTDVRWEDLVLLRGDEARFNEALAMEAAARQPIPLPEIDVEDVDMVSEQVVLRLAALQTLPPNQRRPSAEALRGLLERVVEAHPGHEVFAHQLADLLLDELGDAQAVVSLAGAVLARGTQDPRLWRLRRRRALARVGPDGLAEALVDDGIVTSARRAREAAAVLTRLGASDAYERAEGAWLTAEALEQAAPRLSRASGRMPLDAVAEVLLTLADASDSTRSVHVRASSAAPEGAATRMLGPGVLEWTEGRQRVRAGAESTDAPDGAFRLLRNVMAGAVGRVRVVLALTPIGGDLVPPEAVIAIEGEVEGDELVLRRASRLEEGRGRTAVRWKRVGPLVGEPIAGYEVRLFPPPNVHVSLDDAAEAESLLERLEDEDALSCIRMTRQEAAVRCNVSPQRDVTRRAWRRVMAPLVLR